MVRMIGFLAAALPVIFLSIVLAQDDGEPPSLEERLAAVERGLASLQTRFEVSPASVPGAVGPSGNSLTLERQLTDLQREIDRLNGSLERVERQADAAQREASQARRDALNAERVAHDAATRVR